jgi:hypothetical protein
LNAKNKPHLQQKIDQKLVYPNPNDFGIETCIPETQTYGDQQDPTHSIPFVVPKFASNSNQRRALDPSDPQDLISRIEHQSASKTAMSHAQIKKSQTRTSSDNIRSAQVFATSASSFISAILASTADRSNSISNCLGLPITKKP